MDRQRPPVNDASPRHPAPGRPRPASPRVGTRRAWLLLPALLALGACGSGSGDDDDPSRSTTPETSERNPDPLPRADVRGIETVYPYRRDGRHADVLARCALIESADEACALTMLPFIVQETAQPSVDDVMERVLVTHDWMGVRFEELLRSRSAELLPLFGSITSVTIGSTVRPSNYWTGTGGIQLDPDYLWLTLGEKANVSVAEDYRSAFAARLAFRGYSSTRVDGESIFANFSDLEDMNERTLSDIELPVMSLLFHELAHAIDYLPPGAASLLDERLTPGAAIRDLSDLRLSSNLQARLPQNSTLLFALANVRFRDNEPTAMLRGVSGTVAGAEMAFDGASHFYSYSTVREDFANLFETLVMKRLFDADVHIGFTNQPADQENFGCSELLVEWGVRNRLGDPTVSLRAGDVVESIYGPDPTLDDFLRLQQGTEEPMEVGVDWCTNRDRVGSEAIATTRSRSAGAEPEPDERLSHAERHAIADARRGR